MYITYFISEDRKLQNEMISRLLSIFVLVCSSFCFVSSTGKPTRIAVIGAGLNPQWNILLIISFTLLAKYFYITVM